MNFIFSHVNGIKRKKLNKKTPFEVFCFLYGSDTMDGKTLAGILGISTTDAEDVIQSPSLLKQLPSLSR